MLKLKIIFLSINFFILSCVPGPIEISDGDVIGKVNVDLNTTKKFIRREEAPVGNMIADSMKLFLVKENFDIDFVIVNSGGIRFNPVTRKDGIYKAGIYTEGTLKEMIPTDDLIVIKEVTGKQLKDIFENSVSLLPNAKGNFLQISKGVILKIAGNKDSETKEKRVLSIKVDNIEVNDTQIYKIASTEYIMSGGDHYSTLAEVKDKIVTKFNIRTILKDYISSNKDGVTPLIDGRIVYQN